MLRFYDLRLTVEKRNDKLTSMSHNTIYIEGFSCRCMSATQDNALDFWYKYDDFFKFHRPENISKALGKVDPYRKVLNLFYFHNDKGTMNSGFKNELQDVKDSIKLLEDSSKRIFDEFFKGDQQLEQNAFELFAQGLLFDNKLDEKGNPRRPEGDKIHMMDSEVTGFVAWHAFTRAVGLLELAGNKEQLLQTDRHICLAAAILATQIESGHRPVQSDDPSDNKPMDKKLLDNLRSSYLKLTFEQIDKKITKLEDESITRHRF